MKSPKKEPTKTKRNYPKTRKSPKIDRRKSRKGVGGRPSKKDEGVIQQLENAFRMDYNVTQACIFTKIDKKTYYSWLKNDKVFLHRMEAAQQWATMLAKNGHIQQLQIGDGQAIRFQLKHKAKDPETGKSEYVESKNVEADVTMNPPDLSKQAEEAARPFLDDDAI